MSIILDPQTEQISCYAAYRTRCANGRRFARNDGKYFCLTTYTLIKAPIF